MIKKRTYTKRSVFWFNRITKRTAEVGYPAVYNMIFKHKMSKKEIASATHPCSINL